MNKNKYLAESYIQLSDERFHQKLDPDPTDNISDTITKHYILCLKLMKLVIMYIENFFLPNVRPANFM